MTLNYLMNCLNLFQVSTQHILHDLVNVRQEFIPFFLNYLRDHTIHLIQSSSSTPSPAKTPSLKKIQKSVKRNTGGSKRQQLFGASPAGDADELTGLPISVFSPNTSIESPGNFGANVNQKGDRNFGKGFRGNSQNSKSSPQCGTQRGSYTQQTPEQRSKQKLSLAEFIVTPDQGSVAGSQSWKKKSPHSVNRNNNNVSGSGDNTPNSGYFQGRKSGGKKRQSFSPLVQNRFSPCESSAPVFSLSNSNDFPPMSGNISSKRSNRRSLDSNLNINTQNSDTSKTSRVINFSNSDFDTTNVIGKFAKDRLKEIKRVSPVTVEAKSLGPRRIHPTLIQADNTCPQNDAFLVPISEHEKQDPVFKNCVEIECNTKSLQEERKLLQ